MTLHDKSGGSCSLINGLTTSCQRSVGNRQSETSLTKVDVSRRIGSSTEEGPRRVKVTGQLCRHTSVLVDWDWTLLRLSGKIAVSRGGHPSRSTKRTSVHSGVASKRETGQVEEEIYTKTSSEKNLKNK